MQADSTAHRTIWAVIGEKLKERGVLSGIRSLVFMDDAFLVVRLLGSSESSDAGSKMLREVRRALASELFTAFQLKTDLVKSLCGANKVIFLNRLFVDAVEVWSFG